MFFNSIDFAIFLPLVFALYWLTNRNLKLQNLLIVCASYVFYGWWDWRFLILIFFSSLVDYYIGLKLKRQDDLIKRKILLSVSIVLNLGLLGFFKYYNFFVDNFVAAFSFFGKEIHPQMLHIILPVGISFYTFQTLSYSIDIYRRKLEPTSDLIAFTAFVSFFPQLVAGPIERATNLLPQFYTKRTFDLGKSVDGLRQMLWGLFKKMVIADNCAKYVDLFFGNTSEYSGSALLLGAIFFSIQIYCDFSGYSDIAIGTGRLFGITLRQNFAFPYFSRDIAEFWRRWHISLSTWFRDYVYIPVGGNRGSRWMQIRNTFILFIISGFWHGANWTFIAWGFLHALYFLPLLLLHKNKKNVDIVAQGKLFPSPKEFIKILVTFCLVMFGFVIFRSENMGHAYEYIGGIFSKSLFSVPDFHGLFNAIIVVVLILFTIFIEWMGREQQHALEHIGIAWNRWLRWGFYAIIFFIIGLYMQTDEMPFIYFQF